MPTDGIDKRQDKGKSSLHSEEDFNEKIKSLDPRLPRLLNTYEEVFGALTPSWKLQETSGNGPEAQA